ncbi:MAG: 2-dehydro-3-deoxy-6-phosphogalactonate aldolase [Halothiobacillaceae bacterium]
MTESNASTPRHPGLPAGAPPLVAILRGLQPAQAQPVAGALFEAGFRCLEVPLNRPHALACIEIIAAMAPPDALVGGGTMLSVGDVDAVFDAGGRLMVCPHCDPALIAHAAYCGMFCAPGVATPSEAFAALRAGAHALKLFPAEQIGARGLKAMGTVLPAGTALWAVGGIDAPDMAEWVRAGATGFGIGSLLFQPSLDVAELGRRAVRMLQAWRDARP